MEYVPFESIYARGHSRQITSAVVCLVISTRKVRAVCSLILFSSTVCSWNQTFLVFKKTVVQIFSRNSGTIRAH